MNVDMGMNIISKYECVIYMIIYAHEIFFSEIPVERIDNVIYGPQFDLPVDNRGLGRTIFDKMVEFKNEIFQVSILYVIIMKISYNWYGKQLE